MSKIDDILGSIRRSEAVIATLAEQAERLATICDVVVDCLKAGGKLLTCGHGGSAADAQHLAEELTGRFNADRRPLPAISLVTDPTLMTCIANDYGFDAIFPRQVEALGQRGDVLVVFSTSGKGEHLRRTVEMAQSRGVITIGLLGKGGGPLAAMVDHALIVADDETARIQEAHTLILHLMLEAVEREQW
jgi:D-sedoheptulose 7-phosphate isomerase